MKRFIFLFAFLLTLFPSLILAGDIQYTKDGYVACLTEKQLDNILDFVNQRDQAAFAKMIDSNQCIILKPGVPVYIMDTKILSGMINIRPKGHTVGFWTVQSAVQSSRPHIEEKSAPVTKSDQAQPLQSFAKIIEDTTGHENANVRSRVITKIPKNTFLATTAQMGSWYEVKTSEGACWVMSKHVKILQ